MPVSSLSVHVQRLVVALGAVLMLAGWPSGASGASSLLFCSRSNASPGVETENHLLLFGNLLKQQLERSSARAAIISRSGLGLDRFNIRLSHAGISLRDNPDAPWSIRQLYFSCDENRPYIYDQGVPGFLFDLGDGNRAYVSMILLPEAAERELVAVAADNKLAAALQEGDYSANSYPYSTRYQNCNQWLMEMLAYAWGRLPQEGSLRARAQDWLRAQGYRPSEVDVKHQYMIWAANFVPLVHNDDQPAESLSANRYQVSLPASIEAFVRRTVPGSQRVQMCLKGSEVVTHRGWDDIPDGCIARPGDSVVDLDSIAEN